MTLRLNRHSAVGVNNIAIKKVDASWTESGITWNNKPTTTAFDGTYFTIPAATGTFDIANYLPLISWVQGVANGTISDSGLALEPLVQTGVYDWFYCKEYGLSLSAHLIIDYTPVPTNGFVQGIIQPTNAATAGARWRLTSGADTAWKTSGTILSNVPNGSYTMTFSNLSGWNIPTNSAFAILGNQTNITGTYGGLAPTFSTGLSNSVVLQGQPAALSVVVTGTPPFLYQWLKNTSVLPSATTNLLSLNPTVRTDTANYSVIVSNGFNVATSGPVKLTIAVLSRFVQPVFINPTNLRLEFEPTNGTVFTTNDLTGYALETSNPLGSTWIRISTNLQVVAGRIRADLTTSPSSLMRFYRVVKP